MFKAVMAIAMAFAPIAESKTLDGISLAAEFAPIRAERVTPPAPPPVEVANSGEDVARQALLNAGATWDEAEFGVKICKRESRCTLGATNFNKRTRDESYGPWQINYYGYLRQARNDLIGSPSVNTSSWASAAAAFIVLVRHDGKCAWVKPYCFG